MSRFCFRTPYNLPFRRQILNAGLMHAIPAINQLKKYSIPLILNTSKTYFETVEISRDLDISFPFIVENGSSIYLPKKTFPELPSPFADTRDSYWVIKLGSSVQEINRYLKLIVTKQDDFTLLSDCSSSEVSKLTGLTIPQSENAVKREFSQPMLWNGNEDQLADFADGTNFAKLIDHFIGRKLVGHIVPDSDRCFPSGNTGFHRAVANHAIEIERINYRVFHKGLEIFFADKCGNVDEIQRLMQISEEYQWLKITDDGLNQISSCLFGFAAECRI